MQEAKAHIISQLQKDILLLQGFKPANVASNDCGLGFIRHAFPASTFPLAALHEFLCTSAEETAASCGFISGILTSLMKNGAPSVWVTSSTSVFPVALKSFGIDPHKIIFIQAKKPKEILWTIEEALKCDAICSVVGDINEISFTESRRLQLAVEHSKVTGFLIRNNPKNHATASVTKWKIKPLPSAKDSLIPGITFPRWDVELIKVRNGKPGNWQMQWRKGCFELIQPPALSINEEKRKIV